MTNILVSGLINIETTIQVEAFPVEYTPVRFPFFGVNSTVSGVGYNLARALTVLGDTTHLLALIGRDFAGALVRQNLVAAQLCGDWVLERLDHTPQSAILYAPDGRRMIHVDLKNIQETDYPVALFEQAVQGCDLAALCNINFSRPFLERARQMGKLVATDVHTISHLEDEYNRDFMAAADLLFMSDERLPCTPEAWVRQVWDRYPAEIVIVGLGARGALLGVRRDHFLERLPAVSIRPVVNTVGAGDALFSSFIHFYMQRRDPYESLHKAIVFAAYKVGGGGAAEGFLDEPGLEALARTAGAQLTPTPKPIT